MQTEKKVCTHVKYYTIKNSTFLPIKLDFSPTINWTLWPKMFKFGVIYHIYLVEYIHLCVNEHELQTNKKVCTHVKYYMIKKLDIFTHKTGLFPINWTFWPKMFKFGVCYRSYPVDLIHLCANKHQLQTKKQMCTHVNNYSI